MFRHNHPEFWKRIDNLEKELRIKINSVGSRTVYENSMLPPHLINAQAVSLETRLENIERLLGISYKYQKIDEPKLIIDKKVKK